MQQMVKASINEAENREIVKEAERLGRKNADCLQLLIRLYSNGPSPEPRDLAHVGQRQK